MCAPKALSKHLCCPRIPAALACPSCALDAVVGDKASRSCPIGRLFCARCAPIVRVGLLTPSSVMGKITFCCGQLYRDRNSPFSSQICRDIDWLCRDILSLALTNSIVTSKCSVTTKESWPGQLCHDIKPLCRDKESPFPGRLTRDIKHSVTTPPYETLS